MGTNYHAVRETNICECCGRRDQESIHIGKKSWGWAFNFRGWSNGDYHGDVYQQTIKKDLLSWRTWKEFLSSGYGWIIKDEYGATISFDDFCKIVEGYGAPSHVREDGHKNLNHNIEVRNDKRWAATAEAYLNPLKHWEDEFGYSFGDSEFS